MRVLAARRRARCSSTYFRCGARVCTNQPALSGLGCHDFSGRFNNSSAAVITCLPAGSRECIGRTQASRDDRIHVDPCEGTRQKRWVRCPNHPRRRVLLSSSAALCWAIGTKRAPYSAHHGNGNGTAKRRCSCLLCALLVVVMSTARCRLHSPAQCSLLCTIGAIICRQHCGAVV